MFTECPRCQTAFPVTAKVLRETRGHVRCSGCSNIFDALQNLTEEPPPPSTSSSQAVNIFEERSRELLKSLDQLAGGDEDVRIEDTGIEWRVLDENEDDDDTEAPEEAPTDTASINWSLETPSDEADDITYDPVDEPQDETNAEGALTDIGEATIAGHDDWAEIAADGLDESSDDGDSATGVLAEDVMEDSQQAATEDVIAGEAEGQIRFDDNTPLPDEFFQPVSEAAGDDTSDADSAREAQAAVAAETLRVSIDTGTEADWKGLLEEVAEPAEIVADDSADANDDRDEGDLLAFGSDAASASEPMTEESRENADEPFAGAFAEADDNDDTNIGAMGDSEAPEDSTEEAPATASDESAAAAADAVEPEDTLESQAETAAAESETPAEAPHTVAKEPASRTSYVADDEYDVDDTLVESIVMEGDTVTDLLEKAERASYDDIPEPEYDDDDLMGADTARKSPGWGAVTAGYVAILLLGLGLAAQYVHANRESLARNPLFQQTVAPVYAAFGQTVTPAWDIRGWQFESTTGSTDDAEQRLSIFSRISNQSEEALPYPLIHVSLTDRWDDVIGSRLLTPHDYLADNGDVNRPVAAGAAFAAVITVEAPAPSATGFKLNLCYPLAGQRLRCAIEDFRN